MTYTILSLLLLAVRCRASPVPLPLPVPQAVTAAIAPSGSTPPDCSGSYQGVFGIAVVNISSSASPTRLLGRQGPSTSPPAPVLTVAQVSQIGDGQVQGGMHTVTMAPVTQIDDGQIQNPATPTLPRAAATASLSAEDAMATTTGDECPCGCPTSPVLGDLGGSQAMPSGTTLTGNPRFPVTPTPPRTPSPTPTSTTFSTSTTTSHSPSSSAHGLPAPRVSLVSCLTNSTLQLTLSNNNLYDALNRTGYIASNYQFQFDGPPQSGALYTSGWSVCLVPDASTDTSPRTGTGFMTLALGNSTTFWQCLSGEFYNLYTENWAAQCSPVEIRVVGLVDCGGGGGVGGG